MHAEKMAASSYLEILGWLVAFISSNIVQDPPKPPKVLGVQCDGLNATVRWEPAGDGGAPILGYAVQYSTSFTPDQWEDAVANVSPNDTMVKVLLSPWANYTFRVIARNEVGASEPSDHPDVCETPPDVPYKNPDNVYGEGTSKDNLIISWNAMPMIDQNAPGFFYRIFWKRLHDPDPSWHQIDLDQGNHVAIVNLPTFTPYHIKVEAHNSKGQARTPAMEVFGFSGQEAPGPVEYFDAIPMGSNAFYLIWKKPIEGKGVLSGYNIYYNEVIGTKLGVKRVLTIRDPTTTHVKLNGLKPNTKYHLQIHAITGGGQGEKMLIEVQTNDLEHKPPVEPQFMCSQPIPVNGKAVLRVTWVPSMVGNPGSHFFVQYRKRGVSTWTSSPPEENEDSILLDGLKFMSIYEMKLVAVDGPFQTSSKVQEIETGGFDLEDEQLITFD